MRKQIRKIYHKILVFLHLSPLSLAEKCRFAFGAAVVLVLALALLLPYIWMGQLTKKTLLDAGKAKAEMLQNRHFQLKQPGETGLALLNNAGGVMDVNEREIRWIRFGKEDEQQLAELSEEQKEMIETLKSEPERDGAVRLVKKDDVLHSNYVRIVRASDGCMSCHNPQGSAGAFSQNEPIGAVVIERPAAEISKMRLLNRFWVIAAGLIAGVGAIIAFYWITQRVILRPIRQLRGLANNVSEGNLDIRSSIKTGDEYERLSDAFNHMLDGLQGAQEKLRQANKQLDGKIAELSARNIELFKANKVKSEFLANISHDFRTPLNAILGFAEIIKEKGGSLKKDKAEKYAENIISGGNRLLNMINDLLYLAKAEAAKMELHIEQTTATELVEGIVATFSLLTKKKKIKVKATIDDDIPVLTTDAGKVQQILYNFLSNAVKFTPARGRIEIRATMPDDRHVRLAVSDTGCGIAEGDKEKIFEKFQRADGSITRQSDGSGLGLAISKELANLLAGSIGIESELGKGTTLWLVIPVTLTPDKEQETEDNA